VRFFSKVPTSQHYHLFTSIPPKLLQDFHSTFFPFPIYRINHSFPLQKARGNKYSRLDWKLCPKKEKAPNDPNLPFKDKEKGGESRSKAWWPMEGEGKTTFHLFPLSPQQNLRKPSIFSFDLTILLYHGFKLLLTPFFSFFSIYKLRLHTPM
jgi:hypothetical protein